MWKTQSDPSDNADQDPADRLVDVKPATWRSKWYDVRSLPLCVKNKTVVVYQGNKMYTEYKCKDYCVKCSRPGSFSLECEPSRIVYIPAVKKFVVTGCRCANG